MPDDIFKSGPYSRDVRILIDAAMALEVNQVWTYAQISEAVGSEVDGSYAPLQEAIRRLSRDHAIELKNVRKVGYVRLDDEGIVEQAPTDRLAITRKVSRAQQRTSNIRNWEALSDRYKREADTSRSILAVMRHFLKRSTIKRVAEEVDRARDEVDPNLVIEMFRKNREEKQ